MSESVESSAGSRTVVIQFIYDDIHGLGALFFNFRIYLTLNQTNDVVKSHVGMTNTF